MTKPNHKRFLMNLILPQKMWFLFVSIAILILTGGNLVQTKSIQLLMDGTQAGDVRQMRNSLILLLAILVLNVTLTGLKGVCNARFTTGAQKNIKSGLSELILKAPYRKIMKCSSGDLIKTVNQDTETVCGFLGESFTSLLSQLVMLIGAFGYLLFTNPVLALITFVYTPFGMVITYHLNKKQGQYYPQIAAKDGEALSLYEQILLQIPVIRCFAMERFRTKKIFGCITANYHYIQNSSVYNAYLQIACVMVSQLPKMIYLILSVPLVRSGRMTLGEVIAVYGILNYMIAPTVYFPFLMDGILNAWASAKRITSLAEQLAAEEDNTGRRILKGQSSPFIELKNVSFGYEGGKLVLDQFQFCQDGPGIVAVTGRSGAGKSTLLDLVAGVFQPDSGTITIGGSIFTMSQDTYIFTDSVLENIRIVKPEAEAAEVRKAAVQAGADSFISELPDGYETKIGDGCLELSGGQKQRISLARMILSNAGILLLDEPTSALDQETEQFVLETIENLASTRIILMSAHRLSLINLADRRVEL